LDWVVVVEIDEAEVLAPVIALRNQTIAVGTVILLVLGGAGWTFSRWMARPVVRLAEAAKAISDGDLKGELDVSGSDEIGDMARAFGAMRSRLGGLMTDMNGVVNAASDGDLSRRVDVAAYSGSYQTLVTGINEMLDALSTPLRQVSVSARTVAMAADERSMAARPRTAGLHPGGGAPAILVETPPRRKDAARSFFVHINAACTCAPGASRRKPTSASDRSSRRSRRRTHGRSRGSRRGGPHHRRRRSGDRR
jgi:methyl-accepting chemotaxis protein